jgi:tetratricopeptide (TPR) repeat protein
MRRPRFYRSAGGGAALLPWVATLLFAALPLTANAQSCGPPRDSVIIAAARARKEGRKDEAIKILWNARQATEQSAPDTPKMALYLRNTAGMNGTDAIAALQRATDIDKRAFGPQNCAVAQDLYALAFVYQPNQPSETERLLKEVINMLHDTPAELGLKSTAFAQLAELYRRQERLGEATVLYESHYRHLQFISQRPRRSLSPRRQNGRRRPVTSWSRGSRRLETP